MGRERQIKEVVRIKGSYLYREGWPRWMDGMVVTWMEVVVVVVFVVGAGGVAVPTRRWILVVVVTVRVHGKLETEEAGGRYEELGLGVLASWYGHFLCPDFIVWIRVGLSFESGIWSGLLVVLGFGLWSRWFRHGREEREREMIKVATNEFCAVWDGMGSWLG